MTAKLSMPMTTDVLKSVCDAYEKRCEMTLEQLAQQGTQRAL